MLNADFFKLEIKINIQESVHTRGYDSKKTRRVQEQFE